MITSGVYNGDQYIILIKIEGYPRIKFPDKKRHSQIDVLSTCVLKLIGENYA
jgi:hypothetical protein